ncbi:acyl-CoA dehydrogenase family protein [Mycolicibacterium sp. P9-22]|uniref:acyl-CoA dehydrogenase family protein n=1 Tax=Mycolicibacterium sp. P9-22 TaxID=2024613 RepID=UPI0011EBBABF|nr:acyl-CoA dehydrogenase family protein [Mycolicibacterium sp. P9-22]KAA0114733.1 acyl-CoA dehydrogenase [Mycolicibacterium sp. P9-22]
MTQIDDVESSVDHARRHVRELLAEWQAEHGLTPHNDSWMRSFDREFSKMMASRGLMGLTWPTGVGGGGRSNVERLAVTEELLRAGAPVAAHWVGDRQIGPSVLRHGSQELIDELIPGILSADFVFCLGMSEPDSGSDLASVRTRAQATSEGWVLHGHKIWTSHAHHATHAYVLARTSSTGRKHEGLSEFIVDMNQPGVLIEPIRDMAGETHFNEVHFDGAVVPRHRLLGVENNGWRQVIEQLSFERGGAERFLSTYPLLAQLSTAAGDDARIYAQLGELACQLGVLRRMAWDLAVAMDTGQPQVNQAAALKFLGHRYEIAVIELAAQIRRTPGTPLFEGFRDALLASPGFGIRGGSADVLLSIITREENKR